VSREHRERQEYRVRRVLVSRARQEFREHRARQEFRVRPVPVSREKRVSLE
jgi:hypothetical protein